VLDAFVAARRIGRDQGGHLLRSHGAARDERLIPLSEQVILRVLRRAKVCIHLGVLHGTDSHRLAAIQEPWRRRHTSSAAAAGVRGGADGTAACTTGVGNGPWINRAQVRPEEREVETRQSAPARV
jgi:hypothetical protein